jgi:ribosomal protein L40E
VPPGSGPGADSEAAGTPEVMFLSDPEPGEDLYIPDDGPRAEPCRRCGLATFPDLGPCRHCGARGERPSASAAAVLAGRKWTPPAAYRDPFAVGEAGSEPDPRGEAGRRPGPTTGAEFLTPMLAIYGVMMVTSILSSAAGRAAIGESTTERETARIELACMVVVEVVDAGGGGPTACVAPAVRGA